MAQINLPLLITYDTKGLTPIADVIAALQAADTAIDDAISLLPSLIDGLQVEHSQINVRHLSQESPLRELFALTLIVAFQDDLKTEIPPMIEDLFKVNIPDTYDSIVTVATMIVLFYGAAFLKDAAVKAVENGTLRAQVNNLISQLANSTGRSEEEIKKIFDAKYGSPSAVKRLTKAVQGFFIPSQREGATPISFDRQKIGREVIKEIPCAEEFSAKEDFERYQSHNDVDLEIHAQDKDKINSGWAAVPNGICEKRLRMKLIDPVTVADIWNRDSVRGDVTIVSKLTADGYVPSEIHLTRIHTDG
ncbi:hypothetical protein [Pararhizobium sp. DWP1-1-3]|uniref:hypothetical protein n=1 Tax=Pararhizobium sp. DWP1-1-3 TaxID=2804652 RepID=UPI003CF58B9A